MTYNCFTHILLNNSLVELIFKYFSNVFQMRNCCTPNKTLRRKYSAERFTDNWGALLLPQAPEVRPLTRGRLRGCGRSTRR